MADYKDTLPGFKKKRVGIATQLRDQFTKWLKPKNYPMEEFSKVSNIPEGKNSLESNMPNPKLSTNFKPPMALKSDMFVSSFLDKIKEAGQVKSTPSLLTTIPKAKKKLVGIKVSDQEQKSQETEGYDKGLSIPDYDTFANPDIKEQTRVKDEFEIGLRYQMPKNLRSIPKKDLHTLSQWLGNQIRQIEIERSEYMERLLKYRASWLDFVSSGGEPVFEGAHNIHIPMVFAKIKAMQSRIFQAVFGIDPPFALKPRDKVTELQKFEKEQLLNYMIKDFSNYGRGWEDVIDRDCLNFVADGTSVTKQGWARDVRKYTDVREEFEGFKLGQPQYRDVEEEVEKILFDGPTIKTVNLEDFYIAGVNVENPDEADLCGDRSFYTKSDLIKLAQQNYFFKEAIDKVCSTEPMNQNQISSVDYSQFKQQKEVLSGVDRETAGHKNYEIFELCVRWDIDHDGIDEELVLWYEKNTGLILRITYLERAYAGALRPYTVKRFIPRPGSPYGIGMAEMLYGLSNAQDYIVNQRLDYGTIRNLPFGFVRAASGEKPKTIRLAPGQLYPLDNPQEDVYFPPLNGGTAYGFQEEAAISSYGDDISGLSKFNLGSTSQQGATRTATGAAALVSEVNANLDIHIKRYQRGYKRNLQILDKQLQELLPLGTIIRMLGMDGKEILCTFENRKAIAFESNFELTANSVSSNKSIERDTANTLLTILQNPLALQAGIVSPENLYNVYKNFIQKVEMKDIDAYITRPQNMQDSPYSAKDELTMILGGVKPPVYMKDRHEEKLAFFQEFEDSDEFSWFGPEQLTLYRQVKKMHQDYANAIAAQMPLPGLTPQAGQAPMAAAQVGAGAGVPQGQPAQQMSDLAPASSPKM